MNTHQDDRAGFSTQNAALTGDSSFGIAEIEKRLAAALQNGDAPIERLSIRPQPPARFVSAVPSQTPSQKWTRAEGFWRSFVAICLPLLLSALEGSVTNTALPTISDDLDLGTKFTWVATAFLLASTIFQPLYSQLGDMWGRKHPMMLAVFIFALGSGICGAAHSGEVLILGRIIQGLGTGAIDLFAEMILCDLVPLRQRGRYLAIKHAVFATGTTLGPLLGGIFAEYNWRWCFLMNVPICAISMLVLWFWLSVGRSHRAAGLNLLSELKKIDVLGTILLTTSTILLLVPLSIAGAPYPWTSPRICIPLALGISGLIGFAVWERCSYCSHPIMPPHVFSNRTTNIAFTLTTIHGFVTYGFQFFLPPFFQAVKLSSPTKSGLEVLPTTLVIVIMAAISGPIMSCWGRYKPLHIGGFANVTLGLGLCTMLRSTTPVAAWLVFQLIIAFGLGLVVSTMLPAVQVKLDESATAVSAGSWGFLRGTGSLFGVAIPGAVFNMRFSQLLPEISSPAARSRLEHGRAYSRAYAKFVKKYGPAVKIEIQGVFTKSLMSIWILFAVVAGIGFVLTWFEKEYKMRKELNTEFGLKSAKNTPKTSPIVSGTSTPEQQSFHSMEEKEPHDLV